MEETSPREIFNRSLLLLGDEGMSKLSTAHVIIFGLGGVGSWTAEALIRTGLQHLTIVDADLVAPSNINRQVPATTLTIGESKTDAMRSRLLQINPKASINAVNALYCRETADSFNLRDYDCIVDAIDSLSDKTLLIYNATRAKGARLFSSMGAALKLDPTRIKLDNFEKVHGCRLAAALRRKMKQTGMYPARRFRCVYSDELVPNRGEVPVSTIPSSAPAPMTFGKVATNGSLCHITAIFGMTLAGLVINHIIGSNS